MADGASQLDYAAAVSRLAALPQFQYDQCRKPEAKALGVQLATLDAAVLALRPRPASDTSQQHGRRVQLRESEPWPEPVALGEVLDAIAAAVRRHVIFSQEAAYAVALWCAHTWIYERFRHTPRLAITSPVKRCGKSTLLAILAILCRRPLKADNISPSGTFRTIEALRPLTLLLDEVDAFLKENEELRGVLNSGSERTGGVIRVVEIDGEFVPVQFATFCPLVLAAIGSIPGTLSDRAIPLHMQRKPTVDAVIRLREAGAEAALTDLGRKLARWSEDIGDQLAACPAIPSAMNDREGDYSVPLLAIADTAGGAWPERARRSLLHLFGLRSETDEGAEHAVQLLGDIRSIFAESGSKRMPSEDICARLDKMDHRPWPEWRNGKPMSKVQLARVLAPFRIYPKDMKMTAGGGQDRVLRGYLKEDFADAWTRYATPDTSSAPAGGGLNRYPATNGGNPPFSAQNGGATPKPGSDSENGKKPSNPAAGSRVADQTPPGGGNGAVADPDDEIVL
jgi:putative DNA primase/helicase